MKESAAYTYRLTDEGDLYIGGTVPEYDSPELYPHYVHRDSVLRVVALAGTRIPRRAFAGYQSLRVAELSGAVSVSDEAFFGCPSLLAIQLSPRTVMVAPKAFMECPRLFCIDYAGGREELMQLLRHSPISFERILVRTLPTLGAQVASGKVGTAEWMLDSGGVLTVLNGSLPDLERGARSPWHAYLDRITHVVIGEGVTRVGARAFFDLSALTALSVVGDTEIADFAFATCHKLRRIDLFCALTRLSLCAFAGVGACELMLPPSLRRIPDGLLQSAFSLKTLVLPLLPAVADAPFLEDCTALAEVKVIGEAVNSRAVSSALMLPRKTKIVCLDPAADRVREADEAFRAAEHALGIAAASYGAAREAQDLALSHTPRLTPLIDEAERGYLTLERERFAPDGTVDPMLERMPYKKRAKLMKRREKERKEELKDAAAKTDRGYERLMERFDAFFADLKKADEACKREQKDLAAAKEQIAAAEARVDGMYPLDGAHRARAAALYEGVAAFTAALPPDILPNAVTAVSEYKMLIDYRRFEDLRASLARAVLLLEECRTEGDAPAAPERRVPPCILVAGGDPATDRSTAACIDALRRAGAVVEWADPEERKPGDRQYDALLLCDGEMTEEVYGGFSHGLRIDERRARRDSTLFSAFFLYGKPIMGIGRGAQQINLYLAGTLRWNMNTEERAVHAAKNGKPQAHSITVTPDNDLSRMYDLGQIPLKVLSNHTSAIRTLGRELVPIAKSRDGVIEAFVHRRVPLIGVQFALDRMLTDAPKGFVYPAPATDDGMTLFTSFVELARRVRERPPVKGTEDRYSDKK